MTDTETKADVGTETKGDSDAAVTATRKRVRHRKRLLYDKILKQMEFYFSEANLAKDRYLSQLVAEDPAVPLDTFLRFNKIRGLTQDVADIAKALKRSTLLVLSDCRTKVRRARPARAYDAEPRTLYVEGVPRAADAAALRRVFRRHGPVAYISLPKYRDSDRIKGYGFVEFEKEEDLERCVSAFAAAGCRLPAATAPAALASVRTFEPPAAPAPAPQVSPAPAAPAAPAATAPAALASVRTFEPPAAPAPAPQDGDAGTLQVLPQREWRRLRNAYLTLQRAQRRDHRRRREQRPAPGPRAHVSTPGPRAHREAARPQCGGALPQPSATHVRFDDDDH